MGLLEVPPLPGVPECHESKSCNGAISCKILVFIGAACLKVLPNRP